jgi:uncharacterized protein YndB with AHSA1/START domain
MSEVNDMTGNTATSIEKSVYIAAPPECVFDAITQARHWDKYFTTGMELDPRPGGVCNFRWKDWGPHLVNLESPGRVLEIDPPERFTFEWGRPGEKTTARLSLKADRGGTILSLFEDGYPDAPRRAGFIVENAAHWGELLVLIKFYVEHKVTYTSPSVD